MSKNALVLEDHFGDDGHAREGAILRDVTSKRFDELEKKGLVREATAEEVKNGDQLQIDEDPSKGADARVPEITDDAAGGAKEAQEPDNKAAPAPKTKAA